MANHVKRREARKAENAEFAKSNFVSHHHFARIAPEKVRMVADQIRGMPINRAVEVLKFSKKRGGYLLGKVVKAALANAEFLISEKKLDVEIDSLLVSDVHVDEGPSMKRWMTRSRGMAYPILRRFCHISATLSPTSKDEGGEGAKPGKAKKAKGGDATPAVEKKAKKAKAAMAGAK